VSTPAESELYGTERACSKCRRVQPIDQFPVRNPGGRYRTSQCRGCRREHNRMYYRENRDVLRKKAREHQQTIRYGKPAGWYAEQLAAQGGVCAICGASPASAKRAFAVDHDHACCPGRHTCGNCVRGILCVQCNTALASVESNDDWIAKVLRYLERHRGAT
jgi:hypothetical protein